jgi:hypothetical protein
MTEAVTHEVKSPSVVLSEDVICQSFIQSSSTLAYACLLIRRGRHDLAAHVLHSMEAKPASRFKDMIFYLQAQIGIETGDFAAVKRRLVPRVHQHPNDMVALSLLASCVHLEWEDWRLRNPGAAFPAPLPERAPAQEPVYHTLSVPTVPSAQASFPGPLSSVQDPVLSDSHAALGRASARQPAPASQPASLHATPVSLNVILPAAAPASAPAAASASGAPASESAYTLGDGDFGIYQPLAAEPNTFALSQWNSGQRKLKIASKRPEAEALVSALPQALPFGLSEAVRALDGGEVIKACFSFQALTVMSLHAGSENLGLVTGNLNQSLLTMVRAENTFLKATHGSNQAASARIAAGGQ